MSISKYTLFIIILYFSLIISQLVFAKHLFQRNETNNSKQFQESKKHLINQTPDEKLTMLDYYFFTYDVIDHKTILVKFDLTRTSLFQQSQILYDAYLYVSKIPSINYKINIGPFSGLYEKELHGTITDHFTFCLVLLPNRHQKKFNITLNRNKTETTIYDEFFTLTYQKQQQHIVHYCTKMGPVEEHHRHHKKQGSKGDHILLLLQLTMIVIFLVILQIAHTARNRKYKEWYLRQLHRFHHENVSRKEYANIHNNASEMLQFTSVNNEESQEEIDQHEEADEEEFLILSHRRIPTTRKRQRSRSPSPTTGRVNINPHHTYVEHILENKPWLQIPHSSQ